jgi:hypothetical protein
MRLWNEYRYALGILALVAFDVVIVKQWIPVWLAVIIFCAPTVLFVATTLFALVDPYWLASVRQSTGALRVGQRKRP